MTKSIRAPRPSTRDAPHCSTPHCSTPHCSIWRHRRIASKFCVSVSIFALTVAGSGLPAGLGGAHYLSQARAAQGDVFAGLTPIAEAELDRQRGGFEVGNLDISIGVSIESTIDGFVQVVSNFSISELGKIVNVGQVAQPAPRIEVPKIEVPKVVVPKIEVPVVEVPEFGAPMASDTVPGAAQSLAKNSVNLALEAAQAAFNSPEFSEKAKEANPNLGTRPMAAGQPAMTSNTGARPALASAPGSSIDQVTDQLNTAIDSGQKALSDALPVTTITPKNGTGNYQAPTPGSVTLTAADAGPSGEAASPSPHPLAEADAVVSGPDAHPDTARFVAAALGDRAEIVHRAENGHLTIIRNTLDGVSIRQNVSVNLTVENFTHVQEATRIQRNLASIARQIGVFSLRR